MGWVRIKSAPAFNLRRRFFNLLCHIHRVQIQRATHEEIGRLTDIRAGMVQSGIETLFDQFYQPGGNEIVSYLIAFG